jgi:transcriptional regulator with XRE-family HTH domain
MNQEKVLERFSEWLKIQEVFKNRKEIAKYLGISYSHFNAIVRGTKYPTNKLLGKIAIMIDYRTDAAPKYKPYPSEERKYMDFTTELRTWFSQQKRFKTQKDLSSYIGMSYSSLKKYFQGRSFPKGETKEKLYEITRIELLKPKGSKKKSMVKKQGIETNIDEIVQAVKIIEQEVSELRQTINKKNIKAAQSHQPTHVRFADAFYILADEIESFRDSGVIDRQKLRNMISPKDVGYVSAFLKALFDEDKFTDFILFSKYEFDKKGESHDSDS